MKSSLQKRYFTEKLMEWHRNENIRSLPWKLEKDPYKIWLSEIILQQTRAEQGLPYYLKFIEHFPGVNQLADAKDEDVFRLWQGLGYYNRCRNLLHTARFISNDLNGLFPNNYSDLLQLKGVGLYTAAAIASFAYDLPHAVVDGNVNRVIARYFGIDTPFDSTEGKKQFQNFADELLDKSTPASYNQAIMDFGAVICKPAQPLCNECPVQKKCVAFSQNLINILPVKSKRIKIRKRYFNYILFQKKGKVWIEKREDKDIWQNLYQPFLIETELPITTEEILTAIKHFSIKKSTELIFKGLFSQKLTHQIIESRFYCIKTSERFDLNERDGKWVNHQDLHKYAFPKTTVSFLEKNLYF